LILFSTTKNIGQPQGYIIENRPPPAAAEAECCPERINSTVSFNSSSSSSNTTSSSSGGGGGSYNAVEVAAWELMWLSMIALCNVIVGQIAQLFARSLITKREKQVEQRSGTAHQQIVILPETPWPPADSTNQQQEQQQEPERSWKITYCTLASGKACNMFWSSSLGLVAQLLFCAWLIFAATLGVDFGTAAEKADKRKVPPACVAVFGAIALCVAVFGASRRDHEAVEFFSKGGRRHGTNGSDRDNGASSWSPTQSKRWMWYCTLFGPTSIFSVLSVNSVLSFGSVNCILCINAQNCIGCVNTIFHDERLEATSQPWLVF
jgi:hypothetical protein